MSRILVVSLSDLARDSRVDRQIGFLQTEHDVVAAGLGPPVASDVEFVDLRPPARPGAAELARQARSLGALATGRYQSVYWRHPQNRVAVARLRAQRADLVVANDLSALPLACRIAGDAPVIFDAHELSTEEHADRTWWRMLVAPYADALLRAYLPATAGVMTVSPGIADRYAACYEVKPIVVTNSPPAADLAPTPVHAPIRLIHHGGADPQRRLELMIETMDLVDDRFELSLMLVPGDRRYLERLKRLAASQSRVRLVQPRAQREIVAACNAYDVGVYLLPPSNENLRLALPNKLFEYIQARLAVVVGPSPEMAKVIRDHDCGVVADTFTPQALARALRQLTDEQISFYKEQADDAAHRLNAETNREAVLTLVRTALAG